MQKILEIKGELWNKGLSVQKNLALGGLFQVAAGYDMLDTVGYLQPSLAATELTAPVTNPIKVITHWNNGSTQYLYAHTESKLYQYLRNSPYTQTDVSAEIDLTDPTGQKNITGAIIWRGPNGGSPDAGFRYIYAQSTDLRSNTLPVASASDAQILNGSGSQNLDIRKLCIGPDKNLYVGDYGGVAKCITNAGTTGNALNAFLIDSSHTVRDVLNEGRYLFILGDDNAIATASRQVGNYSCRAYFWDTSKTTADVIWDFPGESYLIGAGKLGSDFVVFGYNGIYLTNIINPPRLIYSFLGSNPTITARPANPYQIAATPTAIFWADSAATGQNIYAYGSLPGSSERKFYVPYITHDSTYAHTAISYSAGLLFAAVDAPKFYVHNTGSTRGNASATTAPIQLSQPYRYSHAKVTLRSKLTTGQSVNFEALTGDSTVVSDTDTQSYSAANPRKNFIFHRKAITNSTDIIEDLAISVSTVAGAMIERVAVYGEPLEDANQTL